MKFHQWTMLHVVCSLKPVSSQIFRVPCRFFRPRILSNLNKLLSSTADYISIDVIKSGRDVFRKDCSPVQRLLDQLVLSASYPVGARGRRAESVVTPRNKAAEDLLLLRDLRIREHESCTQRGTDDTTTQSAPSPG